MDAASAASAAVAAAVAAARKAAVAKARETGSPRQCLVEGCTTPLEDERPCCKKAGVCWVSERGG
jgi:hypothetical protein